MDISKIPEDKCYDNSKVECFRNCARKYFFTYVKHWKPVRPNIHLGFGSAWHEAMDIIWALANRPRAETSDKEIVDIAMDKFIAYWRLEGLDDSDEYLMQVYPKTPGRAKEMLEWYLKHYRDWFFLDESFNLIAIEEPFIVPLDIENDDVYYMGRWDKVYEFRKDIYIVDHKTTKSDKSRWSESFSPNSQIDGYIFAGHAIYGDKFWGVMIDGALVQKGSRSMNGMPPGIGFPRIPVQRLFGHLSSWRFEVMYYVNMIIYNMQELSTLDTNIDYMPCFPKNTSYCDSYSGCIYKNICKVITNPAIIDTPDGFEIKPWSPLHGKEKIK